MLETVGCPSVIAGRSPQKGGGSLISHDRQLCCQCHRLIPTGLLDEIESAGVISLDFCFHENKWGKHLKIYPFFESECDSSLSRGFCRNGCTGSCFPVLGLYRGTGTRHDRKSNLIFFWCSCSQVYEKKFNLDRSHKNVFIENTKIVAHRHTLDLLLNVLGKWGSNSGVICMDERGRSKYEMFINISATL